MRYEPVLSANIDFAASGENVVVAAPGAGFKIRVHSYRLVGATGSTANTAKWLDGTGGAAKETIPLAVNTGLAIATPVPAYLFELSANKALILNLTAAQSAQGGVTYSIQRATGLPE